MARTSWIATTLVALLAMNSSSLYALPEFKKAFEEKFVKESKDANFKSAVRKAGCNVCHVKGESKKSVQNDFGQELNKLIEGVAKDRKADAKDKKAETEKLLKELDEAFAKVLKMKRKGEDKSYGERLEAGMLPQEVVTKKKS